MVSFTPPGNFTPGVIVSDTHWMEGYVGPKAGLEAVAKRKDPIFVIQPVA
jgi:hypothetical protein